jgi:hypothetical protein
MAVWMLLLALGCDRNVEPFDPSEEPQAPDLSKLFPAGADQAAEQSAGAAAVPPARGAPSVTAAVGPVSGTLRLAPELEVPSGAVMFLIARGSGAGPPLAVQRIVEFSFPLDFEIGPDDRMIQQIPFEGPLEITARIDGDGNATTREPGDLFGVSTEEVQPGDTGILITIDQAL